MDMDSRDLDALSSLSGDIRTDLGDDLHIQAVVGADRDSPNSLKRASSDYPADSDSSTAKKRRKQSKPVRINAPESPVGAGALLGVDAVVADAIAKVAGDVDIIQQADQSVEARTSPRLSPSLDLEVQVHCQPEVRPDDPKHRTEESPLNLCSLPKTEPPSPSALDDFAIPAGKAGSPVGLDAGSPVDIPNFGVPALPQQAAPPANSFWGMSTPFRYPMMAPHQDQPSTNHQSRCSPDNRTGSCTIFNPDAYCELCNKEFCNKYFLKTHKANKHGIFTSSPGQQTSATVSDPTYDSAFSSSKSSAGYQHGLMPPRDVTPNSENGMKMNPSQVRLQKDLFGHKASNKLYQRKIKVKVFGPNGEDLPQLPSGDRVKMEEDFYEADVERLLSRMSPQISSRELVQQNDSAPNFRLSDRDESLQTHTIKASDVPEGAEGGSAGDSNESTGVIRKETQESTEKSVFTAERMRSLGVINPEAFCEICCKEYCNKYFLRTHKWKRHGIAPPEGDEKESSRPTPSWLQQMQAAPLNLIMDEPPNPSWDSRHSDPMNVLCKYCGQWFPSDQVLQVHIAFVHLPKKEKDSEYTELLNRKSEDPEIDKNGERLPRPNGDRKTEQIESIMDDMKKVQSMLYQLNSLNAVRPDEVRSPSNQDQPAVAPPSVPTTTSQPPPRSVESCSSGTSSGVHYSICKKTFPDKTALQQHMQEQDWTPAVKVERVQEQHWVPPVKAERDVRDTEPNSRGASQVDATLPATQPTPEQPPEGKPVTSTPTSSYCEICNKELCNKYFMKTHMQRMHGIEIENGSQIGGVVCDICNKELCSKYFLRVHKQNTHGIVDESAGPPTQVRDNGGVFNMSGVHFMDSNTQALKPTDLSEMSHRYFTHFNEVCSICNRRFRSVKWLKAHLINDHGRSEYEATAETNDRHSKLPPPPALHSNDLGAQLGLGPNGFNVPPSRERSRTSEGKSRHRTTQDASQHASKNGNHYLSNLMQATGNSSKEYRCSYCPFSTPVLAFLYVHEKSHTGLTYLPGAEQKRDFQCPLCFKNFTKPDHFQRHIVSHQFPGLPGAIFSTLDPRTVQFPTQTPKENRREKSSVGPDREDEASPEVEDRVPGRLSESPSQKEPKVVKCPKCPGEMVPTNDSDSEDKRTVGRVRCTSCGLMGEAAQRERDLSSLESLLKETVTSDVKKRLEDAAKLNDIPASYAVPKTQDTDADPFIMQPFIIEEPRGEEEVQGAPQAMDKKFVPSLVFLPVKERLSRPLTASFTLTPA